MLDADDAEGAAETGTENGTASQIAERPILAEGAGSGDKRARLLVVLVVGCDGPTRGGEEGDGPERVGLVVVVFCCGDVSPERPAAAGRPDRAFLDAFVVVLEVGNGGPAWEGGGWWRDEDEPERSLLSAGTGYQNQNVKPGSATLTLQGRTLALGHSMSICPNTCHTTVTGY